ncbi:MAG: hypothetical protein K0S47_3476 [Herbinix sp.]|nr:hypothetical protein [Herbinix sp.]
MKSKIDWREKNMYCVIVGDIINSKKIDIENLDEINNSIKEILNYINTTYMDSILADFGLVRGDAFEGVLLTHYQMPKIINEIIKSFYKIQQTKVRICVVLDELTAISTDRNEANGPAFYKATDCIAKMKAEKSEHWFQVSILTTSFAQPLLDGILSLISSITNGWTDRQREIVWSVEELSEQQNLVSKKFNISTSVVNKQLKAANYYAYRKAWVSIEDFLTNLDVNDIKEEKSFLAYYGVAQRKSKRHEYPEAYKMLIKAKEMAEKELAGKELSEKELDKYNPQLVQIYNELAEILIKMKDYDTADRYINHSLEAQKSLPKSRLIYAATLNILGDLYYSKNIMHKAMENYNAALDVAINTVGLQHFFTYSCYDNLAIVLRREKQYNEAIRYYIKKLEFTRRHSERDSLGLADVLYNIARCCFEMEDSQSAMEYANEALIVYKNNLPPKHMNIRIVNDLIDEILSKEDNGNDN